MANPPITTTPAKTAEKVTVVVAKRNSIHSGGKVYLPGQEFTTSAKDAAALVKQGVATLPVAEE